MPSQPSPPLEPDGDIAALESLRGKLPDAALDAAITMLRTQNGAIAQGQDPLAVGAGNDARSLGLASHAKLE